MPDFLRRVSADTNITDIVFTSSDVLKLLRNLKVNSSAVPDKINQFFYKNLDYCLADQLISMFNTFSEANSGLQLT